VWRCDRRLGGERSLVRRAAWSATLAILVVQMAAPVGVSAAGAGSFGTASCRDGQVTDTPSPGTYGRLESLAVSKAGDVWAVGTYVNPKSKVVQHRTLVEHWRGKSWAVVSSSDPAPDDVLYGVASISPTDLWAVGYTANARQLDNKSLIEHSDGSSWSAVTNPGNGLLDGVAGTSANDVWAVGMTGSNPDGKGENLIEHWNGSEWKKVPAPDPGAWANGLGSVTALSPGDVWAVGLQEPTENTERPLIEHWNGEKWSVVSAPREGISSGLADIGFASDDDAWAVGWYEEQSPDGTLDLTLTEHWNGTTWSVVSSPSPTGDDTLASEAVVSGTDVWAVGSTAADAPFMIRSNGRHWSQVHVSSPTGAAVLLFAVSAPTATDVWVAGLTISSRSYSEQTFAEHVCPAPGDARNAD